MMAMTRRNKAHTATVNRLAQRYGGRPTDEGEIVTDEFTIVATTTATVAAAVEMLSSRPGRVYVAMTNREGIREGIRAAEGTKVGVMLPDGDVVRESAED
jgi:hypothetical protein